MTDTTWSKRMEELQDRFESLDRRNAVERQKVLLQIHLMNMENERRQ